MVQFASEVRTELPLQATGTADFQACVAGMVRRIPKCSAYQGTRLHTMPLRKCAERHMLCSGLSGMNDLNTVCWEPSIALCTPGRAA